MSVHHQIEALKKLALLPLDEITEQEGFQLKPTLLATLQTIDWGDYTDKIDTVGVNDVLEVQLDLHTHIGRLATSLAIAERYHGREAQNIRFGEVTNSLFRYKMLVEWSNSLHEKMLRPKTPPPVEWILRFLKTEEPHSVLVIGDQNYDPMFNAEEVASGVCHPQVMLHMPWEALLATTLVAESRIQTNPQDQLAKLQEALAICSGMILPREESPEVYLKLGDKSAALANIESVLARRMIAGGILHWEAITQTLYPGRELHYDDTLFELIANEFCKPKEVENSGE